MTVLENVTLAPIKVKKMPKEEAAELALDLLAKVGIRDQADKYPRPPPEVKSSGWPLPGPWPCSPM